jgi:hypothetical protein
MLPRVEEEGNNMDELSRIDREESTKSPLVMVALKNNCEGNAKSEPPITNLLLDKTHKLLETIDLIWNAMPTFLPTRFLLQPKSDLPNKQRLVKSTEITRRVPIPSVCSLQKRYPFNL